MTELKKCPFCGGHVQKTSIHTTVDVKRTNAMCEVCLMEFIYEQNFSYSKIARVAVNASFEEAFNRRVGDDLMERMQDDGK